MGNVTGRAAAGGGHEAGGQRVAGAGVPRATDRSREGTGHGERQEASCWWGNRAGKEGFGSGRAVGF